MMKFYRNHWLLTYVFLVGGILKITMFFFVYTTDPNRIFSPDSTSYTDTALAILKTGHIGVSADFPQIPQVERTPGYPLFIASIFYVAQEKYFFLILAQIVISLGTIALTYSITSRLWTGNIALISTILLSLDIISFVSTQKILTETLFTFFLSLSVLIGIHLLTKSENVIWWVLAEGVLLALTTLIRPITYYLIFPVLLIFFIAWKRQLLHGQWKKIVSLVLVFWGSWGIVIGGWHFRNYSVTGYNDFTAIEGVNLLFYRGADIIARRDKIGMQDAQQRLGVAQYHAAKEWSEATEKGQLIRLSAQWKQKGVSLIQRYPGLFLKSQLQGAFSMLCETDWNVLVRHVTGEYRLQSGPGGDLLTLSPADYLQKWFVRNPLYFLLFFVAGSYLVVLYCGIISSLWYFIRQKTPLWPEHVFVGIIVSYLIIISAGPEAYSRFRIPLMPFFSMYAAHGIHYIAVKLIQPEKAAS